MVEPKQGETSVMELVDEGMGFQLVAWHVVSLVVYLTVLGVYELSTNVYDHGKPGFMVDDSFAWPVDMMFVLSELFVLLLVFSASVFLVYRVFNRD